MRTTSIFVIAALLYSSMGANGPIKNRLAQVNSQAEVDCIDVCGLPDLVAPDLDFCDCEAGSGSGLPPPGALRIPAIRPGCHWPDCLTNPQHCLSHQLWSRLLRLCCWEWSLRIICLEIKTLPDLRWDQHWGVRLFPRIIRVARTVHRREPQVSNMHQQQPERWIRKHLRRVRLDMHLGKHCNPLVMSMNITYNTLVLLSIKLLFTNTLYLIHSYTHPLQSLYIYSF